MTNHRGATMRARLRHLFPPSGAAYELLDCAAFVLVVVGVTYVIEDPQPVQQQTLGYAATVLSLSTWGAVLSACAVAAIVCAYIPRWVNFGYGLLVAGCTTWSAMFVVGIVFFDGTLRSVVSALIYAWVVRRLVAVKARGV